MPGSASAIPIGVFRGRGADISQVEAYEAWLGRGVDYVLDFMLESPGSWAAFEHGYVTSSTQLSNWAGRLGSRRLAIGVPACCMGTSWSQEASGENDAHWTAFGVWLIDNGFCDATLRIAREFNGGWYKWQVKEGKQPDHIAGWQRIVMVLRGIPGQRFTFCWNPIQGQGNLTRSGAASCYPGDLYVDQIGLDTYDTDWTGRYDDSYRRSGHQQRGVWRRLRGQVDGYEDWRRFAQSRGKPMCFPEWGLRLWKDAGIYHGGGDNAYFVDAFAQWMTDPLAVWHAFWEHPGVGVFDPDDDPRRLFPVPESRKTFQEKFGAS